MKAHKIYNLAGKAVGEMELNPDIFAVQVKPVVVQQAVVAQQASARKPYAHTKTRSEVRGGGRKPWRQKGTGRARAGSTRSPIWRGGGVTFGPRSERNPSKGINKKAKQAALRMVLSDKAESDQIILVDSLDLPEIRTKQVVEAVKKLPVKGYQTLFVLDKKTDNLALSARNLPDVTVINANSLNVVELLKARNIIVPVNALSVVDQLYAPKKKSVKAASKSKPAKPDSVKKAVSKK